VIEKITLGMINDKRGRRQSGESPGRSHERDRPDDVNPCNQPRKYQALAYFSYLSGYRYAHEVMRDPLFAAFLLNHTEKEGSPTLQPVPGGDLDLYRRTLIRRFANPQICDTLTRLCAESSDRIPKWLLPVLRANLANGGVIRRGVAANNREIFGDLGDDPRFIRVYTEAPTSLCEAGARETVRRFA
jgi:mannitol 2-dehydrogenase